MNEKDISKNIKNREWRLNNLYYIKDKNGKHILFKLNWAQKVLLKSLWFLNAILKVRQVGITTFFCIFYLDDVIFNGMDAGLIAHTREDAERIFSSKILYAWKFLLESIKKEYVVDSESVRQLKFTRGNITSSIYVGTSLRSGTVQRLHISELATVDQKYPQKAIEIRDGALNTVTQGQIVTVESTAKEEYGVFYDICFGAMEDKKEGKELSKMDYKFFFFPWWLHPEYELHGDHYIIPKMDQYFKKIECSEYFRIFAPFKEIPKEKKAWYVKKHNIERGKMKKEYPSTPEEAFETAVEGSYYAEQFLEAESERRITSVPAHYNLPVDTFWDLGNGNKMCVWCTQDVGREIHIIDYLTDEGYGLLPFAKALKDRKYIYRYHYMPHDAEPKEIGSGKSIKETAEDLGISPIRIIEQTNDIMNGIHAVRMIFNRCWFDKEKCKIGLKALRHYSREYDENGGIYKKYPKHNWASHPSDAFRTFGVGHEDIEYNVDEESFVARKTRYNSGGRTHVNQR